MPVKTPIIGIDSPMTATEVKRRNDEYWANQKEFPFQGKEYHDALEEFWKLICKRFTDKNTNAS